MASTPVVAARDRAAAWEAAVLASGLPAAGLDTEPPRPRLLFGPPLPVGMAGERELVDLVLTEPRPIAEVRAGLAPHLPTGIELVDLHDVWLGAPSLAAEIVGAVYRVEFAGPIDEPTMRAAAAGLLDSSVLPRSRPKGDRSVEYDLRPLLRHIAVVGGEPRALEIEVRFDPALGVGRPEEVVAALGERLGSPLVVVATARARIVLTSEHREADDSNSEEVRT